MLFRSAIHTLLLCITIFPPTLSGSNVFPPEAQTPKGEDMCLRQILSLHKFLPPFLHTKKFFIFLLLNKKNLLLIPSILSINRRVKDNSPFCQRMGKKNEERGRAGKANYRPLLPLLPPRSPRLPLLPPPPSLARSMRTFLPLILACSIAPST